MPETPEEQMERLLKENPKPKAMWLKKFLSNIGSIVGGILIGAAIVTVIILLLGYPVMWLWNTTLPNVFGWSTITFWEAVKINLLCSLLFKASTYNKN